MEKRECADFISLSDFEVTDRFWKDEMELVRKEVIPYQWEILNDNVEGAAKSYCIRNFKVAADMINKSKTNKNFSMPKYTFRGFEALPEDENHLEDDKFYGFVFQDSDLYKWIEAASYSLVNHKDLKLEETIDYAVDLICSAQLDNGYLDTYYIINGMDKAFSNTKDHHELYCFGHLAEAAVAYFNARNKDKLLKAAERFADYIAERFGRNKGQIRAYPGHEIAEMALVRMYDATSQKKYFELAKYFIDERGTRPYYWFNEENDEKRDDNEHFHYYQAHKPVRMQTKAIGHAVRAVYLYSGMVDVARRDGDEELLNAAKTIFDDIAYRQMYITGGIGATSIGESFTYDFDLSNDLAYSESCASIGLLFFASRLLNISADRKYADVMERALYNTILAGIALDGKSFFYVNPLEVVPNDTKLDLRKQHVKSVRQKWFGCACCPPNIARLLSSLQSYAISKSDNTIFINLHIGGIYELDQKGEMCRFKLSSTLPFEGTFDIEYDGDKDIETEIAVRIPSWSKDTKTCGIDNMETYTNNGYMYIKGIFKKGMKISFVFDMSIRINMTDSRVRADRGKVALSRGPIVYCLEGKDNIEDLGMLYLNPEKEIYTNDIEINGHKFTGLVANGYEKKKELIENLYSDYKKADYKETTLQFVPYFAWANRGENEMRVFVNVKE